MERSIGEMGHKIRLKKAPFANLANIIFQRELIKILLLYYPIVDSSATDLDLESDSDTDILDDSIRVANTDGSIFMQKHYMKKKQPLYDAFLSQELHAISTFLHIENSTLISDLASVKQWGKLKLPNGHVLGSRLSTQKGQVNRRSEWFEVCHKILFIE